MAFTQRSFPKDKPFGNKIYFYLEEAIGEKAPDDRIIYVPEYLVFFENLAEIALEYDLELDFHENFHDYYSTLTKSEGASNFFQRQILKPEITRDKAAIKE